VTESIVLGITQNALETEHSLLSEFFDESLNLSKSEFIKGSDSFESLSFPISKGLLNSAIGEPTLQFANGSIIFESVEIVNSQSFAESFQFELSATLKGTGVFSGTKTFEVSEVLEKSLPLLSVGINPSGSLSGSLRYRGTGTFEGTRPFTSSESFFRGSNGFIESKITGESSIFSESKVLFGSPFFSLSKPFRTVQEGGGEGEPTGGGGGTPGGGGGGGDAASGNSGSLGGLGVGGLIGIIVGVLVAALVIVLLIRKFKKNGKRGDHDDALTNGTEFSWESQMDDMYVEPETARTSTAGHLWDTTHFDHLVDSPGRDGDTFMPFE
jgi:hypothetical protein